ncbi:MAG TPA: hypothetical protein VG126_15700 [Thermoleophilaceae bacterium]|nr:hypothetical protein [Thermoleophilaceae bacterium]
MIGEQRAVRAFLRGSEFVRGELEVEVRECLPTTDPRSDRVMPVPPLVILWSGERPLAVRLRSVVAVSRFPTMPHLVSLLDGEARSAGFAVEQMPEAGLWRLFAQPPRPRPVGL